ncbi:MAG: glucokinase [Deltaproteobacteria bacterium]|nr:glucokinase [Deltaproteobacteria bacterium]
MILAGDIGGTKTVLALCDENGRVVREDILLAEEHASLEAMLDKFLRGRDVEGLTGACFGVAGPVDGKRAKITNLPWVIDAGALSTKLGGIPVSLLNDLQATALGTLVLPATSFAVMQEATNAVADGPIAVIAPGTGLGEALLVAENGRYRALPSEGGHADFAPTTEEEIDLLRYLRKLYSGHVSYERVLSGDGIGDLYNFVRLATGSKEPTWLAAQIASGDRNAVVSKAALEGTDAACVRALEMFAEILGAEAGNLALRAYATGGVIIGGGIPPKILPALQSGALMARFHDKGRFAGFMRSIGVRVTLEPRAALLGAAHHAAPMKGNKP